MTVTITTNNVPRDIVYGYETTPKERAALDYVDWVAVENGEESFSGFRYKGELYDLSDIPSTTGHGYDDVIKEWDGVTSDSFFSGMVVKYEDNFERVIVGMYFCE